MPRLLLPLLCLCLLAKPSAPSVPDAPAGLYDPSDPHARAFAVMLLEVPPAYRVGGQVRLCTVPKADLLLTVRRHYGPQWVLTAWRIGVAGLYVEESTLRSGPPGGTIYVADTIRPGWTPHLLLHEWGHHVEACVCTPVEQRQWAGLWSESCRRDALPTHYAGANEREGFAECFEHYVERDLDDAPLTSYFDRLTARLDPH